MSQVDDFHYHVVPVGGYPDVRCAIPGAVYDCDDEQCSFERKVIEGFAEWPIEHLDSHIASHEAQANKLLHSLTQLRYARELKRRSTT